MMELQTRHSRLFAEAERRARDFFRPGQGIAALIGQLAASPSGDRAAGAAVVVDKLEGTPTTRIALIDLKTGDLEIVTRGPLSDSQPRWSPDGKTIAFLSDRDQLYVNRLRFLDPLTGEDRAAGAVDGLVEYHQWSADGRTILLGVAGFGADLAGAQGGFSLARGDAERPSWAPSIDAGVTADAWRGLWLYDVAENTARKVTPNGVNVWEAVWCGPNAIAAVCSDAPGEQEWYTADLRLFDLAGGGGRTLFKPKDQIGWLSASPSGARLAIVEAVCSDRTIVAGDMRIIETDGGRIAAAESLGADVVQTIWRGEDHILFAAVAGPESAIGLFDVAAGDARELWRSLARTPSGGRFPEIAPLGDQPQDCLFAREAHFEAQAIVALEGGREREIRSLGSNAIDDEIGRLGSAESVSWTAPDGLTIHGWLLKPPGEGPHPLVLDVHGGPVWLFRPSYIGKWLQGQMLLAAGYAVLQVNPRGSSGRGQDFARQVFGDMGGADTYDYLSGIDALVERGVADPTRLGVTGGSYGGFMSAWLITQDDRFAAAVPVAPVTDWVSEHLTCHIPFFCEMFLADKIDNPTGKYFTRSPIHFAHQVKTPTLNICGALDKNTPAVQAEEFHHALLLNGVQSVLVKYPEEGHGVRKMPAQFDCIARIVGWFETHMPAKPAA